MPPKTWAQAAAVLSVIDYSCFLEALSLWERLCRPPPRPFQANDSLVENNSREARNTKKGAQSIVSIPPAAIENDAVNQSTITSRKPITSPRRNRDWRHQPINHNHPEGMETETTSSPNHITPSELRMIDQSCYSIGRQNYGINQSNHTARIYSD